MGFIRSVLLALAMFSRVPVPRVDFSEKNMRYLMAAFPLVGAVVGAVVFAWGRVSALMGFGDFLLGAGFAVIPVLISGGIHMDGFCDVTDALSSRAEKERKLEILADPHIGAFAAMACGLYLLLFAALACEVGDSVHELSGFSLIFVFSRCLSGLSVLFFPGAKKSGLNGSFSSSARPVTCAAVLSAILCACGAALTLLCGNSGLLAVAGGLISLALYHKMVTREFGGVTGDTAGWFLQVCEAAMLCGLIVLNN